MSAKKLVFYKLSKFFLAFKIYVRILNLKYFTAIEFSKLIKSIYIHILFVKKMFLLKIQIYQNEYIIILLQNPVAIIRISEFIDRNLFEG